MALRLIEMVLREKDGDEVREHLEEHTMLEYRQIRLPDGEVLVRILLDVEHSEGVLDFLEKRYADAVGNRVVILPVEATLPHPKPEPAVSPEQSQLEEKPPERISRHELYEDIKDGARCSRVYLAMAMLATVVAAIGLQQNSVAIIIGAMVIAPLLGPNVALSLSTTLGDMPLLRSALLTALAGIAASMVLSVLFGVLVHVDPALSEVASRTQVKMGDIAVALASGLCRHTGIHHRCLGSFDRRDGGGSVIAAAGDVRADAGRRASGTGTRRAVAVSGQPDLREPCRSHNVSGAGHSPGELVGERPGAESHAHRHWAVGGAVGGVDRHDPMVPRVEYGQRNGEARC